jgi:uncharacterized protein
MTEIKHEEAAHRFTTEVDGQRAVLDYTIAGDVMTITHTGVPQAIGGRGIAGELMRAALDAAKKAGWKVIPVCSYAAAYLAKHPEVAAKVRYDERLHAEELLDEALEETFPASDPPSVGRSS